MRAFKISSTVVALGLLVLAAGVAGVEAQDPSLVLDDGGLQFPDGTVQATAAAGGALVEDTGQTACFDASGTPRACLGTGEDGEHQAGLAWPTPRFTDNVDGTVTDDMTGLIWLKDANCPAGSKTWQQALDWVDDLNTTSIACTDYTAMTFTDWRLPNVKELQSLLNYGATSPALPAGHPFVNAFSSLYWSSSTYLAEEEHAWCVDFDKGDLYYQTKGSDIWVWPVRGGQ